MTYNFKKSKYTVTKLKYSDKVNVELALEHCRNEVKVLFSN